MKDRNQNIEDAFDDVRAELSAADAKFPPYTCAHHGYAIIKEELDELWDEIRKKQSERSKERLRAEAMQVASTALRFMVDICLRDEAIEPTNYGIDARREKNEELAGEVRSEMDLDDDYGGESE